MSTENDYFAHEEAYSERFAAELFAQMRGWQTWIVETGLDRRWTQNLVTYHGANPKNFTGTFGQDSFQIMGANGEIVFCSYNDYRNLLQHILNMTVGQPPNLIAQAVNDDNSSIVASQTFEGLFQYYMTTYRNAMLRRNSRLAVENCLWGDTGWMLGEWDADTGKPIAADPATGQVKYEGDMYFKARLPWDVSFDPGEEDEEDGDWRCVRDEINKFELAARFPQFSQQILSKGPSSQELTDWRRGYMRPLQSHIIDYYKFYMRPTRSRPKGRHAILLDAKTVLLDEDNPYEVIPLFSVRAMEGVGGVIGYAPGNLLLPVQAGANVRSSAMMTNDAMFGVQNITVKSTDDFDIAMLAGGMNVLKYNEVKPEALQLAQQANGIGERYQMDRHIGETLVGMNGVARGDPEKNMQSGTMLGIMMAQATSYNAPLAASYAQFLQNVGNFMLYCFRTKANTERITQIVGKNNVLQSAKWSSETFGPIDRVYAEVVDPAMRTLGFKTETAFKLLNQQVTPNSMIKTPQEFFTLLTTGQFKPLIQTDITQSNLVRSENEDMLEKVTQLEQWLQANGAQQAPPEVMEQFNPPVLLSDDDQFHKATHDELTSSPAVRRNSALTQLVLYHQAKHDENMINKAAKQRIDAAKVNMIVASAIGMTPASDGQTPQSQTEIPK